MKIDLHVRISEMNKIEYALDAIVLVMVLIAQEGAKLYDL